MSTYVQVLSPLVKARNLRQNIRPDTKVPDMKDQRFFAIFPALSYKKSLCDYDNIFAHKFHPVIRKNKTKAYILKRTHEHPGICLSRSWHQFSGSSLFLAAHNPPVFFLLFIFYSVIYTFSLLSLQR